MKQSLVTALLLTTSAIVAGCGSQPRAGSPVSRPGGSCNGCGPPVVDQPLTVVPRTPTLDIPSHAVDPDLAGYLGVAAESVGNGALIQCVYTQSPARLSGLAAGDIVVGYGNQPIRGAQQLSRLISQSHPYVAIQVRFLRNGTARSTFAKLGVRSDYRHEKCQ